MFPRPAGRALFVGTGPFHRHSRFNVFFRTCFTNPFFDPFFCRHFFFPNRFLFAQPVFLPYSIYTAPNYQDVEQTASTADRESDLAREIERLTNEVGRLREEQTLHEPTQQAAVLPRPSLEENTPSTILLFRDGHRSEVRNYAIVGQTVWVFTEQRARKIPLSDLDIEATRRVNSERGVEVPLPLVLKYS
jgi:hypothetical protein